MKKPRFQHSRFPAVLQGAQEIPRWTDPPENVDLCTFKDLLFFNVLKLAFYNYDIFELYTKFSVMNLSF